MPLTLSDADTKDNERFCRLHISPALLRAGCLNFLAIDQYKANLCRTVTEHQASAHAEAIDGAVALHIDLRRFDVVFLQASLERRQIEAAVIGAKSLFRGQRQPVATAYAVASTATAQNNPPELLDTRNPS